MPNFKVLMISRTSEMVRLLFIVSGITTTNAFGLFGIELPEILENAVFDKNIHSVQVFNDPREFSIPVIELNSDQQLELRFDDLSGDIHSFGYTLIHCDANWKKSDLSESEYLEGFGSGVVRDYQQSLNTTMSYVNYSLLFPEENCMPVISGNFALVIYDDTDNEKIILVRRFYVTESSVNIEASVRQPLYGLERTTSQQLQLSVNFKSSEIRDPQSELVIIALQNYRYNRQLTFTKPYTSKPGRLEFTDPEGGMVIAGNEFRTLDIKSMRYQTENIAQIDFRNPYYHVVLKPDKLRSNKPWFSKADLNGHYYIDRERSKDRHTEADYVYVHFSLELPPVYSGSEIYVAGQLTDWKTTPEYRMKQNPDNGLFELTLLLKQGLYDYCFMIKDNGTVDETDTEGSYYETENDYSIFVYYKDPFKRYHRLTGYLPIK